MPIYCYECEKGHKTETYRKYIPERVEFIVPCPTCGLPAQRSLRLEHGGVAFNAEVPTVSDAVGIDPSQITEAKRRFPDHEYTPDGSMVFHSRQHRLKCLADIGFHDHDEIRGGKGL